MQQSPNEWQKEGSVSKPTHNTVVKMRRQAKRIQVPVMEQFPVSPRSRLDQRTSVC